MRNNNLDYYNEFTLKPSQKEVLQIPQQNLLVKKEKKKRKVTISLILVLFTLISLFFIANAFSNLLAFSTVSLYDSNAIVVKSYQIYMLEVKDFDDKDTAQTFANEIKLRGGAGVVIYDSTYKVVASCYNNLQDAQNVMEKLKNEFDTCKIYTLKLNKLKLVTNDNEIKDIDNILEIFKMAGTELIDLAIKLDKGELTSSDTRNKLFTLYESISKLNADFKDCCSKISNDKVVITQAKIDQEIELLKHIIENNQTGNRLSAEIKEGAINSFLLQNELALLIA